MPWHRDAFAPDFRGLVFATVEDQPDEQAAPDGFATLSPNGHPVGAQDFIAMIETKLGHTVRPGKRGRKPHGVRME